MVLFAVYMHDLPVLQSAHCIHNASFGGAGYTMRNNGGGYSIHYLNNKAAGSDSDVNLHMVQCKYTNPGRRIDNFI